MISIMLYQKSIKVVGQGLISLFSLILVFITYNSCKVIDTSTEHEQVFTRDSLIHHLDINYWIDSNLIQYIGMDESYIKLEGSVYCFDSFYQIIDVVDGDTINFFVSLSRIDRANTEISKFYNHKTNFLYHDKVVYGPKSDPLQIYFPIDRFEEFVVKLNSKKIIIHDSIKQVFLNPNLCNIFTCRLTPIELYYSSEKKRLYIYFQGGKGSYYSSYVAKVCIDIWERRYVCAFVIEPSLLPRYYYDKYYCNLIEIF